MAITAFELMGKIGLDGSEFERGLDNAKNSLSNAFSTASALAVGSIATAGTAITALVGQSVEAYGNYEQLVGGVETLFGTQGMGLEEYAESIGKSTDAVKSEFEQMQNAQELVLANANEAYRTAGLSVNEYMETITSFAASLKQSTKDETETAEIADLAIRDMADNANKMGTAMESIQNAYSGFAKQNYTMLDNLKLGYGGTKEEMERLLEDASKISGIEYDISNLSDVYQAIHVIQSELGITGTTAKESASTIQGSLATTKSAWENLVMALGNEEIDIAPMISALVESATTLFDNVKPVVIQSISGISELISNLLPRVVEMIPDILNDILPQLIDASINLVSTIASEIGSTLPTLFKVIMPKIVESGTELITQMIEGMRRGFANFVNVGANIGVEIINALTNTLPQLIEMATELVSQIALTLTNSNSLERIASASLVLINALVDAVSESAISLGNTGLVIVEQLVLGIISDLPKLLTTAGELINEFVSGALEEIPNIIEVGTDIITSVIDGISDTLPELIVSAIDVIEGFASAILDNLPAILDSGIEMVFAIINGIVDALPDLIDAIPQIINSIVQTITVHLPEMLEMGVEILLKVIDGIIDTLPQLIESIPQIIIAIVTALTDNLPQIYNMGVNILSSLLDGVVSLIQRIGEVCGLIIIEVENYFSGTYQRLEEVGKNLISGLINGITSMISDAVDTIKGVGEDIISSLKDTLGIHSPSKVFAEIGEFMMLGAEEGVESEAGNLKKTVDYAFKSAIPEDYDFGVAIADSSTAKKAIKQICDDWEEGILTAEEANYEFAQVYKQVEELNAKISQEYSGEREKITQEEADKKSKAYEKYLEKVKTNEEKYKKDKDKLDEANAKAYKDYTDKCLDIEKSYNTKRENLATKGNKALIDISATYYEETAKAVAKQQDNIEKQLEKLADAYEKEVEKIQQNVDKLTDKLAGAYKDYTQLEKDETTGKISVLTSSDLQARADEKKSKSTADEDKTYYDKLEALRKEYQNADLSKRTEYFEKVKKLEEEHKKALETIETTYAKDSVSATEMSMEHRLNTLNDYYASVSELMERGASVEMLGELKGMSADEGSALADYWNSLTDEELSNLSSAYTEMSTKANEIANLLYKEEGKSATDSFAEGISEVIEGTDSFELIGRQALDKVLDGFADKDYVMSKLGYFDVYSTNRQSVVATEKTNSQNNKIDISIGNLNASAINSANQVTEIAEQLAQMIMKGTVTA